MSESLGLMLPGELMQSDRPWLRRLGSSVLRYSKQLSSYWPILNLAQELDKGDTTFNRDTALADIESKMSSQLDLLRRLGVAVIDYESEVDWVPEFVEKGCAKTMRRGLITRCPYVDGMTIDEFEPMTDEEEEDVQGQLQTTVDGLRAYLDAPRSPNDGVMTDIFYAHQYMIGTTEDDPYPILRLVDVEPRIIPATQGIIAQLNQRLDGFYENLPWVAGRQT